MFVFKGHFEEPGTVVYSHMAMGQNRGTLVNIKIDGKWMFIHPNMVQ